MTDLSQKQYLAHDILEEPGISPKDLYFILLRNIKVILWSIVIMVLLSVIYTLSRPPIFSASAVIMIEEPSKGMNVFDMGFGDDRNQLNNEIEILKSRSMAEAVVNELWKSPTRNRLHLFGTKRYEPRGARKIVRRVLSLSIKPEKDLPVFTGLIPDSSYYKFVAALRSKLHVTNQKNTNALNISMTSIDPEEAALLANTLINKYQAIDMELHAGEIINLRGFLEEQAAKVLHELNKAEEVLRDFQTSEKIYGLDKNGTLILEELTAVETEYFRLVAEENIAKERKIYFQNQLTKDEKSLTANLLNSINTRVFALRSEIATTEADVVRNSSLYGENHEMVRSGRGKIEKLKQQLSSQTTDLISKGLAVSDPLLYRQTMIDKLLEFEGEIAALEYRVKEYKNLVDQYNSQLSGLPTKSLTYARLERDRTVLAETYILMRQKLEEAKISQASQLGKVRILDTALPPLGRTKPNTEQNLLLGLLLGGGIGIGLAIFLEYMDNTVKTVEDIEKKHLTVLGIIPALDVDRSDKKKMMTSVPWLREVQTIQRRIITTEDPKSPISEAYRSLRTSILYSSPDKPIKSMIISSAGPGEGKTTTTTNLAITFANMGKKTLLIDADLRRPVLHHVFGVEQSPGLTDYLLGSIDNFDTLVKPTETKNLFICTSGISPPNPSELLGSKYMSELIGLLESNWDIILLDTPPLVAVTDATIISREIDAMILVVHSGKTDKHSFERTIKSLRIIDVPLLGVVLNAVTSMNSYGTYSYYYQNYNDAQTDND
jgi:capsular exopolysaccharide synthesis family protein